MTAAGPDVPLFASALLFAAFAVVEWRRVPVWARIHLGVATDFALAASRARDRRDAASRAGAALVT